MAPQESEEVDRSLSDYRKRLVDEGRTLEARVVKHCKRIIARYAMKHSGAASAPSEIVEEQVAACESHVPLANGSIADMWHAGSQSFYSVVIQSQVSNDEALRDVAG